MYPARALRRSPYPSLLVIPWELTHSSLFTATILTKEAELGNSGNESRNYNFPSSCNAGIYLRKCEGKLVNSKPQTANRKQLTLAHRISTISVCNTARSSKTTVSPGISHTIHNPTSEHWQLAIPWRWNLSLLVCVQPHLQSFHPVTINYFFLICKSLICSIFNIHGGSKKQRTENTSMAMTESERLQQCNLFRRSFHSEALQQSLTYRLLSVRFDEERVKIRSEMIGCRCRISARKRLTLQDRPTSNIHRPNQSKY